MKTIDTIALASFIGGVSVLAVPFISSYVQDNLSYIQFCAALGPALIGTSVAGAHSSYMRRALEKDRQNNLNKSVEYPLGKY